MSVRETFGKLLAAYRDERGLTLQAAADELLVSRSLLQKLENDHANPQADFAVRADRFYRTVGDVFQALHDDVIAEPYPGAMRRRVKNELHASVISIWSHTVPDLAQTEDYARAGARNGARFEPPGVVDEIVRLRMQRQDMILKRDGGGPGVNLILSESALRQGVGGPEVMARQLEHLEGLAVADGWLVQVVPFTAYDVPMVGSFTLFEFRGRGRPAIGYTDGYKGSGTTIEGSQEVGEMYRSLSAIRGCAMPSAESLAYIGKVRAELYEDGSSLLE